MSDGTSISKKFTRHGETRNDGYSSPEYISWMSMKNRCLNPRAEQYPIYGGRGIKVCDAWLDSFPAFLTDMGRRPTSKHTIDRIDVDGPYEKSNCRWATRTEQSRNQRTNRLLTFDGITSDRDPYAVEHEGVAMSIPTAHWNVANIALRCPKCGASAGVVLASSTGEYRGGRVLTCWATPCDFKFRIPSLNGAHGPDGRGYS